jgi:hypothetical protein
MPSPIFPQAPQCLPLCFHAHAAITCDKMVEDICMHACVHTHTRVRVRAHTFAQNTHARALTHSLSNTHTHTHTRPISHVAISRGKEAKYVATWSASAGLIFWALPSGDQVSVISAEESGQVCDAALLLPSPLCTLASSVCASSSASFSSASPNKDDTKQGLNVGWKCNWQSPRVAVGGEGGGGKSSEQKEGARILSYYRGTHGVSAEAEGATN